MSEPSNHFNTFKFALVVKCKQMQTTNTYSSDFSKIDFSCEFKKLQLQTLQRICCGHYIPGNIYMKWSDLHCIWNSKKNNLHLLSCFSWLPTVSHDSGDKNILLLLVNSVTVFDSERNTSDMLLNACVHISSILMHVLITFLEQVKSSGFSLMGVC